MIHNPFLRAILRPPAELYGRMMRLRAELYRRGVLRAAPLPGKTISVGNLTLGGTGKTPMVIWLARHLQAAGYRPGILARGYGRRDANELVVLRPAPNQYGSGPGEAGDSRTIRTGDEALLFRRHLPDVPIGLCADRVRAANALAAECGVNLFLLDDGYQRLDVARDVNLLLVDASETTSAGQDGLIPIGRLREPESAASRADLILLTRCEERSRQDVPASESMLREKLRRLTAAPIFRARTRPVGFFLAERDGQIVPEGEVRRGQWLAFCGIGNPAAFFADLRRWGLELAHCISFRDHHRYSPDNLAFLEKEAERRGATGLITTEKDFINLPPATPRPGKAGLPLYYCRIVLEPVEPEFWQEILRRLEQAG
ncbi:MAG TPA: tetraacyldisaccharide 4'-kinase [Candidatus Acidoferrales bacterium]